MKPSQVPCPLCGVLKTPNEVSNFPRHKGCKGGGKSAREAMAVRRVADADAALAATKASYKELVDLTDKVAGDALTYAANIRAAHSHEIADAATRVRAAIGEVERAAMSLRYIRARAGD